MAIVIEEFKGAYGLVATEIQMSVFVCNTAIRALRVAKQ